MAADFGLRRALYEHVWRLTCAARRACARISHAAVTDVVRQILTDENIVSIVNKLICLAISEGACVDCFQFTYASGESPISIAKSIF